MGEPQPMPHSRIDPKTRKRAKRLRREMTDAERHLWWRLRELDLPGIRFRRQSPIGPYIVDFACLSRKLIIEIDGGQHATAAGEGRDNKRTAWLEAQGFSVLRFWNTDVLTNPDGVLTVICSQLEGRRHD